MYVGTVGESMRFSYRQELSPYATRSGETLHPSHLIAHRPIYRTFVLYIVQLSGSCLAMFRISVPFGTCPIVFPGTDCI